MTLDQLIYQVADQAAPYTETVIDENVVIRTFDSANISEHQLKWHWDEEDRIIEVLEDSDWKFQYDNELPIPLITGVDIKIPAGMYHRLILGTGKLSLKINKIL
jgi:hypothetical protein